MHRTPDVPAVRLLLRPYAPWKAKTPGSSSAAATARCPSYQLKSGVSSFIDIAPARPYKYFLTVGTRPAPRPPFSNRVKKRRRAFRSPLPEKGLCAAAPVACFSAAVASKKHGSLSTMSEQGGPTRAGRVRPLLRPRGGRGATNKRVNPLSNLLR